MQLEEITAVVVLLHLVISLNMVGETFVFTLQNIRRKPVRVCFRSNHYVLSEMPPNVKIRLYQAHVRESERKRKTVSNSRRNKEEG